MRVKKPLSRKAYPIYLEQDPVYGYQQGIASFLCPLLNLCGFSWSNLSDGTID